MTAWEDFKRRWSARYPVVVASWEKELSSLLRFYSYPKELWAYLRSRSKNGLCGPNEAVPVRLCANLLERFHRKIRRGTKVRDHQFPKPDSVLKLIYLESDVMRLAGKGGGYGGLLMPSLD